MSTRVIISWVVLNLGTKSGETGIEVFGSAPPRIRIEIGNEGDVDLPDPSSEPLVHRSSIL